jgi:hypothetical protein
VRYVNILLNRLVSPLFFLFLFLVAINMHFKNDVLSKYVVVYLHTNELNTTFFCSTSPLKAPNRLKSLKIAGRFVLTSGDIYQNHFTQEKILKF